MAEQHLVHQNGDRLFVTSLDISNRFGRQHKDVLRAIRELECTSEFNRRNFAPVEYLDAKGEKRPAYELTRDGFVFLCMGFTGPQAALWKERYIEAFNRMELALRNPAQHPAADLGLAREIGQLKDVVAAQNQAILALYQEVDGARRGHIRALTRLLSLQERQQKREAKETILRLEAEGVPRELIARQTGRTLNHIRQVIWRDRHPEAGNQQGELALGGAA